jgi:hypothetical protein
MTSRLLPWIAACLCAAPSHAQTQSTPAPAKLITLEKIELGQGLVSPEVAQRFGLQPALVESRLRAAFAANLSAQLSSSRQVKLSAREESLGKLMKEWEVSEKLGNPGTEASDGPGVDKANFVATGRITDLIAQRETLVLGGEVAAAKWKMLIEASIELIEVSTGRKLEVLTQRAEKAGQSRGSANFTTLEIQEVNRELATQLAARMTDILSPIRIVAIRGDDFIIDRGKAASIKVGDRFTVLEPAEGSDDPDAAFPVGEASVVLVTEKTSNLRLKREKDGAATALSKTMRLIRTDSQASKNP